MKKVRLRFPPSPTGELHIGGLRTALYNYLFAKQNGGEFVLRIEDTDRKRFVEGSAQRMMKILEDLGLKWNEGPYVQSERLEIYREYVDELIEKEKAYYCFCEPERLDEMRKKQSESKQAPMYDQYCLKNLTPEDVNKNLKEKCPYTVRLKIPEGKTVEFEDVIRGKISFNTNTLDDQVLLKSDGYPTYHLANVVDDHLMEITHVVRGEEWLPSTPKHILLYQAFGWDLPKFAHLPLLLGKDRKKLSKRQADVAVEDYLKKGYIKEALINFVALLGWNPGKGSVQEIFSLKELIEEFKLEKVHKAGAIFDPDKLNWINSQYIKKLSVDELYDNSINFWKEKDFYEKAPKEMKAEKYLKKVLTVEQERMENFSQVGEGNEFFFGDISFDKELLRWKDMSDEALKGSLEKAKKVFESISEKDWTQKNIKEMLLENAGENRGEFLWPLRVALTGEEKSPSPFEVAWVLGKSEAQARVEKSIKIV